MMRTTTRLSATVVSAALLFAACGDDDDGADATTTDHAGESVEAPSELVSDGTVTICSDTPYEPFEFKDDAGEDTGFDMDIVREIATSADLDITVVDLPFDGILGSLEAGDCDVVASAVTITDERAEQVDFTDAYFDAEQSLLVKTDQAEELATLDDLAGATIGVQSGTTGEAYANENATDSEVRSFEDADGLFAALEADEIQAILQDLPVNGYRSTQDPSVTVVETYATDEQYGFAVRKGNAEMLDFLNAGLEALRSDGTYDELYATYFGEPEG
jgi:polar amino acid transport system substrate-binding protein